MFIQLALVFVVDGSFCQREVIRFSLIVYSSKDFVLKRGVNFPEDKTEQKEGRQGSRPKHSVLLTLRF